MQEHLDTSGVFVGRQCELDLVVAAAKGSRLVTVVGPGGTGKSRLVSRYLERYAPVPPGAVHWAELSSLPEGTSLATVVAGAFGLADHTAREPMDALCAWLGGRRLLLVLDSCEHVSGEAAALVADLLTVAPGLSVVATSRRALGLPAEYVVPLGPLGHDDALELFARRAAVADQGLALPWPAERVGVAREICHRLQGIPLTLELAAAQLGHLSMEELALRLRRRVDPLTANRPHGPRRHRSLRTAIGWSHEGCEPGERLLWARLSVFQGRFEEADARAVCAGGPLDPDGVSAALDGLAAKSVVRRRGTDHSMLDTVREYGDMWLGHIGERHTLRIRHAAHFGSLVRQAEEGWLGPEQGAWYQRLRDHHRDLCAALDFLLRTDPDQALAVAAGAAFFWACCGHLREANDYLAQALSSASRPGEALATRARWALGVVLLLRGEEGAARDLAIAGEAAAMVAHGPRNADQTLDAAYLLGLCHLVAGRPLAARIVTENALEALPGGAFTSAARLRCHLARVFALTATGLRAEARSEAEALRSGCIEIGEQWARSYLDYQLSLIALLDDDPSGAAVYARSMLEAKNHLGDSFGAALGLDLLAAAHAAGGDAAASARAAGAGYTLWQMVGHPQRGTPELGPLREEGERMARGRLGDDSYDLAFDEGARGHRS
ncbi:AAA family ATPase [Streptomyces sp. NPDC089919]|uniref:ATP-binding protein n=1 Tax=Streptomyces sp. NPDC089919 TaxID=3155188 RepID=UPI00341C6F83